MKNTILIFAAVIVFSASCNTLEKDFQEQITGEWELVSTSGGFTGAGIDALWDNLKIEGANFELRKMGDTDNEIIASGKIEDLNVNTGEEIYEFNFKDSSLENIALESDSEKIIEIDGEALNLFSPCCDRINYHLEKM